MLEASLDRRIDRNGSRLAALARSVGLSVMLPAAGAFSKSIALAMAVALSTAAAQTIAADETTTPAADAATVADTASQAVDRAKAQWRAGDWAGTVREFDAALKIDPSYAPVFQTRGWMRAQRGELPQAIADYDLALKLDPTAAETWCNRGHALSRLGKIEAAERDLSEAVRLKPDLAPGWTIRAWLRAAHDPARAVDDYAEAIRLRPDDAKLRCDRADCLLTLRRWDEAIDELSQAMRVDPEDWHAVGLRGAARIYRGDLADGADDVRKAISLAPNDAGRDYQPTSERTFSREALEHGRRQVDAMLRDRPAMAEHAAEAAALREWAVRKFAGEDLGEPILWNAQPPLHSDAENLAPEPGKLGEILVDSIEREGPQRGQPRPFEDLWAGAVFELHNVCLGREFLRLHDEAAAGKLTKEEFVASMWRAENRAMQQTRAFYAAVFLPLAERVGLKSDPDLWFAMHWEDPDHAMQHFVDRNAYPWRPYGRQYDWIAVRRAMREGRARAAIRALRTMAAEPGYPEDEAEVQYQLGRNLLSLGRTDEALRALTAALEIEPHDAQTLRARARAYTALKREKEAAADNARADKLDPE